MSTFVHLLLSSPSSLKLLPGCVSHSLTLLFVCVNLLPIFFHLYLSSLPSTPPFSPPLPFVSLAPLYFISFHHPSEQNCIAKIPRALLSITMSLNVRTRTRRCPIMQICTADAPETLLSVLLLIVLKLMVFIKFYRCRFMYALCQGVQVLCVPFEWPCVPGRFLFGYSESPDGLMCLISRSHEPLWTHSTDP